MHRRRFITGCCACGSVALAGCLVGPLEDVDDTHPFANAHLEVSVANQSQTGHDLTQVTEDAMAYWEDNSPTFAGFEVNFSMSEMTDPDIIVTFVDDPEPCSDVPGWSERVLGCAPLLRPGDRVQEPVTAYVVAARRPVGKVRITTKHEFGHLLGLYHTDEPLEIMSNLPEHRIPLYAERIEIWERTLDGNSMAESANVLLRHAISNWNDENYTAASTAFDEAHHHYLAARDHFAGAREDIEMFDGHPQVETVDLPRLRSILDTLIERMETIATIASLQGEAAGFVADDEYELASDRLDTAESLHDALAQMPRPALRDVAVALGLVTGFDLEDPAAPVEDEPDIEADVAE